MYSAAAVPVARTSSSGARGALPLAAICCLGTLCFLIAATIVLALIPIYLPNKNAGTITLTTTSSSVAGGGGGGGGGSPTDPRTRWIRYTAIATAQADGTAQTGPITNLVTVGPALGLTNGGTVIAGQAQANIARQKRSVLNRRRKRAVRVFFTFQVIPTFTSPCDTACQTTTLDSYLARIQANTNINNVEITIRSGNGEDTNTYDLVLDSILTSAPVGFNSTNTIFSFTAAQSGDFNNQSTWVGLIVPYGDFEITIPAGITVTIGLPALEINMRSCTIDGTLLLGETNTDGFTFNFPTTILIRNGGILQLQSRNSALNAPRPTLILIPGTGRFFSDISTTISVNIFIVPGKRRRQLLNGSSTVSITAAVKTVALPPTANGGGILGFDRPTFVGTRGGDAQDPTAYCGGRVAPTNSTCGSSCGIHVAPNCALTTASFNGVVTLPITVITAVAGATLTLGTPGSTVGFSFAVALVFQVSGALQFAASGGGILVPLQTTFTLLAGAVFTSPQPTFIQSYDPITRALIGDPKQLPVVLNGPLFVVTVNGVLVASRISPGLNDFGNGTSTTAAGSSNITTLTPSGGSGVNTVTLSGGSGVTTATSPAGTVSTPSTSSTSSTTSTTSTTTTSSTTSTTSTTTTSSTTSTTSTTMTSSTTSTTSTTTTTTASVTQALG